MFYQKIRHPKVLNCQCIYLCILVHESVFLKCENTSVLSIIPNIVTHRLHVWLGPLHLAARGGRVEMLQFLAERGAVLDCQDDDDMETPLHLAAKFGYSAAVRKLISLGADRTIQNWDGRTAEELL